jgi:hypothetical protein
MKNIILNFNLKIKQVIQIKMDIQKCIFCDSSTAVYNSYFKNLSECSIFPKVDIIKTEYGNITHMKTCKECLHEFFRRIGHYASSCEQRSLEPCMINSGIPICKFCQSHSTCREIAFKTDYSGSLSETYFEYNYFYMTYYTTACKLCVVELLEIFKIMQSVEHANEVSVMKIPLIAFGLFK